MLNNFIKGTALVFLFSSFSFFRESLVLFTGISFIPRDLATFSLWCPPITTFFLLGFELTPLRITLKLDA